MAASCSARPCFLLDARVQNGLELLSRGIVSKNLLPHGATIQGAIRVKHGIAECFSDLIERRLAGLHKLARDDVSVDDGYTEFGKRIGNQGLAAGDSASQAYSERLGHSASVTETGRDKRF